VFKLGVGLAVGSLPVPLQNLIFASGIPLISDAVSAYLATQLVPLNGGSIGNTAQLLLDAVLGDDEGDPATVKLIDQLNTILNSGIPLNTVVSFANVEVRQSTLTMALTGTERVLRRNRLLVEDAYRGEISRSLDPGFVVKVVTPGSEWRLVRVSKVEPIAGNDKIEYQDHYTVKLVGGSFVISQPWRGIEYQVGRGNAPLWESNLLRDKVFRVLFDDWQNGSQNFPDIDQPGRKTRRVWGCDVT
jgi:hypothetical protein